MTSYLWWWWRRRRRRRRKSKYITIRRVRYKDLSELCCKACDEESSN
jgi:hypothetical protein